MLTLNFYGESVDDRNIARAVEVLERGGVVIYPTDTLYALGCDALNSRAIERLCSIKGLNPDKNLLSIVCSDLSMASEYARIDNKAFSVLRRNLPGPFTFVLPASTRLPRAFKGRRSVGVRIPACEVARALAAALGHPLLTTSVLIDDDAEAVDASSIAMHYEGRADMMLDAGPGLAVPSAVIDLSDATDPVVLREGPAELQ